MAHFSARNSSLWTLRFFSVLNKDHVIVIAWILLSSCWSYNKELKYQDKHYLIIHLIKSIYFRVSLVILMSAGYNIIWWSIFILPSSSQILANFSMDDEMIFLLLCVTKLLENRMHMLHKDNFIASRMGWVSLNADIKQNMIKCLHFKICLEESPW